MSEYEDIIHLPRPRSSHPPMERAMRAAQFSSFAALRGFDDEIAETARYTEERPELDEGRKSEIADMLATIQGGETAEVVWFVPDEKKRGGARYTKRGEIAGTDGERGLLRFADGDTVPFDAIIEILF